MGPWHNLNSIGCYSYSIVFIRPVIITSICDINECVVYNTCTIKASSRFSCQSYFDLCFGGPLYFGDGHHLCKSSFKSQLQHCKQTLYTWFLFFHVFLDLSIDVLTNICGHDQNTLFSPPCIACFNTPERCTLKRP